MTDSVITATLSTFNATEGGFAESSFTLSSALTSATTVSVSLTGAGATAGNDYDNFEYKMEGSSTWSSVLNNLITINAGFTKFHLRARIIADSLTETNESITFVVSQNAGSVGLKDSWWVQSTANLQDASSGAGAGGATPTPVVPLVPVTITTTTPTSTALEGDKAIATYKLSALGADAEINVSVTGQGAGADDFSKFFYRFGTDTSTSWSDVLSGKITLAKGTTEFQLATDITLDKLVESNESVVFVVSQSASTTALKDSWWVQSTANLQDASSGAGAGGATTTFTGGLGRDNFSGTAGADIFVIPSGSSLATNSGYDVITKLTTTDKIDLPSSVGLFTLIVTSPTPTDELTLINAIDGKAFGAGNNNVNVYTFGGDAYLVFDANNNKIIDLTNDMFIKVVGGALLDFSTILV